MTQLDARPLLDAALDYSHAAADQRDRGVFAVCSYNGLDVARFLINPPSAEAVRTPLLYRIPIAASSVTSTGWPRR